MLKQGRNWKLASNIFPVPDLQTSPDPYFLYSDSIRVRKLPIVIDNGSYECRVGWSSEDKPRMTFKNIIAKQRGKKESEVQVGNDITNIELVRWLLKTQFDKNVVTHFDVQEQIFDHIFNHLGISSSGCVDHPIVLTEVVCNPSYSRQNMSELLFECYQVPLVLYGIDALFSFRYNQPQNSENGIVISCGYHTVHILPVVGGKLDAENCRRISVGGNHLGVFMQRLLQLKYPHLSSAITLSRAEYFGHEHAYFAEDYQEELQRWVQNDFYDKNVHRIQLPFNPTPGPVTSTGIGKMDHCHSIVKRVQEIIAKRKQDRLADDEEKLQQLSSMQELLEDEDEATFRRTLQELGFSSPEELHLVVKKLKRQVMQVKSQIAGTSVDPESHESLMKKKSDDLDPRLFPDPDTWISIVRKRKEEIREKRMQQHQRFLEKAHSAGQKSKFKKKELPNEKDDGFEEEDLQGREEELEEIIQEFEREFKKKPQLSSEHSMSANMAEYYQLHLGIERVRVPELLFQPSLRGFDQVGIAESLEFVFAKYDQETQERLAKNIFLTGGSAAIPGFEERMSTELLAMRPFQSTFSVSTAKNPVLDSWRGASQLAHNRDFLNKYAITKKDYQEKGPDYLKEHKCSNMFMPYAPSVQSFGKTPATTGMS